MAPRPESIELLPNEPGVYRFRDTAGRVLYIGRATSLRSRVGSYWGDLGDRRRLAPMIPRIATVEAIWCDSPHEAAWLERNLHATRLPPWNRALGGAESEVFVRLDAGLRSPGLTVVHQPGPREPGVRYFGPYLGGSQARAGVAGLHRVLPLRFTAERLTPAEQGLAAARGVRAEDRARLARRTANILARKASGPVRAELERLRAEAVAALRYELAGLIQAELEGVAWLCAPQRVTLAEPVELELRGRGPGFLLCLGFRAGRLSTWTVRRGSDPRDRRDCWRSDRHDREPSDRCSEPSDREPDCPAQWREFVERNVELAARLRAAHAPASGTRAPARGVR